MQLSVLGGEGVSGPYRLQILRGKKNLALTLANSLLIFLFKISVVGKRPYFNFTPNPAAKSVAYCLA